MTRSVVEDLLRPPSGLRVTRYIRLARSFCRPAAAGWAALLVTFTTRTLYDAEGRLREVYINIYIVYDVYIYIYRRRAGRRCW